MGAGGGGAGHARWRPAAPGIDTTVYGSVAQRAPAPMAAQAAAPDAGRGLFMTTAAPPPARRYGPVPAPRYAPAPANPVAYAPAVHDKPYTLDSGDRLRIVVFGQDGLSNSYVVDASGYIAMPLIGSVLARGATTDEFSAESPTNCVKGTSMSRTLRSKSKRTGRSSSSARSPNPANILTSPT